MRTRILITAATEKELNSIDTSKFGASFDFDLIVTGVGTVSTVYEFMSYLRNNDKPDYIINIGIAGSFTTDYAIGDTVIVESDCFADIGMESQSGFTGAWEAGLINPSTFPFEYGFVKCDPLVRGMLEDDFKLVRGITVNTVSGKNDTIERRQDKFNPDIETMEVAAAIFVARKEDIPLIALRSISNFIEPRNKDAWDILSALSAIQPGLELVMKKIDNT